MERGILRLMKGSPSLSKMERGIKGVRMERG
jgi:hypothetical protein